MPSPGRGYRVDGIHLRNHCLGEGVFFGPFDEDIKKRPEKAKKKCKERYPKGTRFRYTVKLDFTPFKLNRRWMSLFFNYLVRHQPSYRLVDKVVGLRLLSFAYFAVKRSRSKMVPKIARKSAMGLDAIFK